MVFDEWYPVTEDMGLIEAEPALFAEHLVRWHGGLGTRYRVEMVTSSLGDAFGKLPPLSMSKPRRLIIPTRSSWTAVFQNGIQGSDPFPAMSHLARTMRVRAMRVCATPDDALYPGVAWEVYGPPELGGAEPLGYIRSISCINDGGRWSFDVSGKPFPFEEPEAYRARRLRTRFDRARLARYLEHFGLRPFADDFYEVSSSRPAILLHTQDPKWQAAEYTLEEVRAGKPWQR